MKCENAAKLPPPFHDHLHPSMWDFEMVEAALIECAALWRRTPGRDYHRLRAGDGPWSLVVDDRGIDAAPLDSGDLPVILPLRRSEVARRDAVSEWLGLCGAGASVAGRTPARIVAMVAARKASGGRRVGWRAMFKGEAGAAQRAYGRAIASICAGLNAARVPVPGCDAAEML